MAFSKGNHSCRANNTVTSSGRLRNTHLDISERFEELLIASDTDMLVQDRN